MPNALASPPNTDLGRGLSSAQAAARLAADGPNVLSSPRPPHPALLLLREMTHFFAVLLWVASGLALLAGMAQLAIAIAVVVVVNGVFAFVQEYRADRAERLHETLPARVTVRRDGRRQLVDAPDLVVGDVVLLEAGDRVSADLLLVDIHDLALNESLLTGESVPVRPATGAGAYAGTFVVEGEADAVVVAIGSATRLAGIAALTRSSRRPPSPLARQLGRVVRVIAAVAVGVGTAFFAVSALLGTPPSQGFLFGVGVMVALVPDTAGPCTADLPARDHTSRREAGHSPRCPADAAAVTAADTATVPPVVTSAVASVVAPDATTDPTPEHAPHWPTRSVG